MIARSRKTKTVVQRITELFTTATEIVRHSVRTYTRRWVGAYRPPIDDWGRSDYSFWRRAFRANVKGLEYSGLFIKPVVNKIAAWSISPPPEIRCDNERSQEEMNSWLTTHRADVLAWLVAALKVGDGMIVVNPDLSTTLVPADYVDPIVDEMDYSRRIGWRIAITMQHPQETRQMIIIDEYYDDRRVHRVEVDGMETVNQTFPNLIGINPVIHLANLPDEGKMFGFAEAESAINLLYRYNDVLLAGIEGNILQGRPTPVANFATEQDLEKFWELYGESESQTLPDGTTETTDHLNVDLSEFLTMSAGTFDYAQPGSFIGDTAKLLELQFYLLLEHWEMPEFVFGNAIASSQASAETQMPIWEAYIRGRQIGITQAMIQLARVVNAYHALLLPGVARVEPKIIFKKLTQDGKLTLDALKWLKLEGLLDDRTALLLAPVDIENVDDVLERAQAQQEERRAAQEALMDGADLEQTEADQDREIERLEREPTNGNQQTNGAITPTFARNGT